ncbi:MAG: hypothetical protein WCX83_03230 [Candidatus Cloacimonas sp.]|nr:hypothetical protein [Candidatus Cloacimonadota bacterium]
MNKNSYYFDRKSLKWGVISLLMILFATPLLGYSFGKNKVQTQKQEWTLLKTVHFDIYYPKGADEFGHTAALMSEEAYYYLQEAFNTPLLERVPIIFYESHRDFQVTNIIYSLLTEGVGGFTESLRNRVVIPFDGSYKKLEETLIHELTHAYVNGIESDFKAGRLFNIPSISLPFWFSEGLPEYLSIGGEDNYNNMFVMDIIFNHYLQPLERIGGYYAYRMGESFLTYLGETYGKEKVLSFFYSLKSTTTLDSATKREFDLEFEELELRWHNYLSRKYTPHLLENNVPYEVFEQLTNHKKDGSTMNIAPRFSPDGLTYLYFSDQGQRMSIWRGDSMNLGVNKRIIKGESSGKFEQFHFQRNNISWFPDSKLFAFVAKTKSGDIIYIADSENGNIYRTIEMFDFEAVYEIDVSPDGERIVFSGQKGMQNNIYLLDLHDESVKAITNSFYYDNQPVWSPNGKRIAFVSERVESAESQLNHIFNRLTKQIYLYDIELDLFYQVTFDSFDNYSPTWNKGGDLLIFISERDKISNFHAIQIKDGRRAVITNTLTGAFIGDLGDDDKSLIFSVFYNNGWDLYLANNPLSDLVYEKGHLLEQVDFDDDFHQRFELARYAFHGFDEQQAKTKEKKEKKEKRKIERGEDGALFRVRPTFSLDQRPTELNEPKQSPYKVKFALDSLWGGMAYSSAYGTVGHLQLGFSDVMGDHYIGVEVGIAGSSVKESDFMLSYLYLPRRVDYGFGVFRLTDEAIFAYRYPTHIDYIYEKVVDTGGYALFRYPFNRFWRTDFGNTLYKRNRELEYWDERTLQWYNFYKGDDFVYSPQLSITHDNIIYGVTGPMEGWRGYLGLSRSFSREGDNYTTIYGDIRKYHLFAKKYSFATKFVAGSSAGKGSQYFRLDGLNGVRGLTERRRGSKLSVATLELRFPFVDRLDMSFPLPMSLYQIRGSLYTDFGAAWDANKNFKGMEEGKLKDLVLGLGFGPRVNLGIFVLSFDVAWQTNLSKSSKPNYYISINEDF